MKKKNIIQVFKEKRKVEACTYTRDIANHKHTHPQPHTHALTLRGYVRFNRCNSQGLCVHSNCIV